ncbi:MAG TPA: hypothetical protein VK358_19425 [Longimicrobium sp.]|nr:hypothetical protein [Longimicrobium sp.]
MKLLRLFAIAAAVSLAACSSSPTDSVRAGAPSFDGGTTTGSGTYTGDVDGPGASSVSSDTATTNGKGGNMLGSGN